MGILNILLYVLLIYMVYRSYTLSKKTKKNRELINIIVQLPRQRYCVCGDVSCMTAWIPLRKACRM